MEVGQDEVDKPNRKPESDEHCRRRFVSALEPTRCALNAYSKLWLLDKINRVCMFQPVIRN